MNLALPQVNISWMPWQVSWCGLRFCSSWTVFSSWSVQSFCLHYFSSPGQIYVHAIITLFRFLQNVMGFDSCSSRISSSSSASLSWVSASGQTGAPWQQLSSIIPSGQNRKNKKHGVKRGRLGQKKTVGPWEKATTLKKRESKRSIHHVIKYMIQFRDFKCILLL